MNLLRFVWRRIYSLRPIVVTLLYPVHAVEYLLLLTPHLLALRRADAVFRMVFGSFGHQGTEPWMLAMRYKYKRLVVVLDDYKNYNPYILQSFESIIDIRTIRHTVLTRMLWDAQFGRDQIRQYNKILLRIVLRLIGSHAEWVEEFCGPRGEQVEGSYINTILKLIRSENNITVEPLTTPVQEFESMLHSRFPTTKGTWFVSLYLRKKKGDVHDVRDTDPLPYRLSIERIIELGGFVLCGGDYNPRELFPDIEGIYGYSDFSCSRWLCDYYFLTQPVFMMGGHSGPVPNATVFSTPCLVTNNAFFYLSGYREMDMVIWKKLRDTKTGSILPASKTFTFPIVELIENKPFAERGLEHIDNTEEELLSATNEMLNRHVLHKPFVVEGEYKELYERLMSILPSNSVAVQSECMPCYSYLKNLQW